MTASELENKWKGLKSDNKGNFKSLRLSADCVPELYIGIDSNTARSLILRLPKDHSVSFASIVKQNLSLELFRDTDSIVLKLTNFFYLDLFNDLIISLYHKVRILEDVNDYTKILIDAFFRWSDFFSDNYHNRLSDEQVMGLIGEMYYLAWEIQHGDPLRINEILSAWRGPFDEGHDFVFSNRSIEVKTKHEDAVDVTISSEFQLQSEAGKDLLLLLVTLENDQTSLSLSDLATIVRGLVVQRLGDFSILLKALFQKGLTMINLKEYDHIKFKLVEMTVYNCTHPEFPKITVDTKPKLVNTIRYNIRISELDGFILDRYNNQ